MRSKLILLSFVFSVLLISSVEILYTSSANSHKVMKICIHDENKAQEFKKLFAKYGYDVKPSTLDIQGEDSDPMKAILHKISQVQDGVVVEEVTLDIDNLETHQQLKWLVRDLDQYEDQKATWTVYLAYRVSDKVLVFKGKVEGKIVLARKTGVRGLESYFLPNGSKLTLAEEKSDSVNARAKAVKKLIKGSPTVVIQV